MIRLRVGISYALTEAMDEGHCGLPTDQLIPLAEELLEAPRELILTALGFERSDGAVIATGVVAEVGDLRRFDNPRQLMAISAWFPVSAPAAKPSGRRASPGPAASSRGN
jgi:transposase